MKLLPRFRYQLADVVMDFVKGFFPFRGVVNVGLDFGEELEKLKILLKLFHKLSTSGLGFALVKLGDLPESDPKLIWSLGSHQLIEFVPQVVEIRLGSIEHFDFLDLFEVLFVVGFHQLKANLAYRGVPPFLQLNHFGLRMFRNYVVYPRGFRVWNFLNLLVNHI